MPPTTRKDSIHDVLRLIFRRRYLFVLASALFAIIVLVAAHYVPLKYTGEAIFEFGLETAAEQISRTSKDSFGTIKERMRYDLGGYLAIEKAVRDLQLTQGLPHDNSGQLTSEGQMTLQKLVNKFMGQTEIKWEARSAQEDLVAVRFTHSNPQLAQQMPNTLVANYINKTYESIRAGLKRQYEFLKHKVQDIEVITKELTKKKVHFETQYAGILPKNPLLLHEKIQTTREDLEDLRRRQMLAKQTLSHFRALRQASSDQSDQPVQIIKQPNPELPRSEEYLRQLKDDLDSALTLGQMTEKHPTVKALKIKISRLEKRISEMPQEVIKEKVYSNKSEYNDLTVALATAQADLEMTTAEIPRLQRLLTDYEQLWANFAPIRLEYLQFLKEWNDRTAESENWKKRLENVEVALGASINNRLTRLNAIQPAYKQFIPSFPPVWLVLGFSIIGALAFGGGLVFFANSMDRSISSTEQARDYFDLPIHGVTGEIITPKQKTLNRVKNWFIAPAITAVLIVIIALSGMSIVLKLKEVHKYEKWKESPVTFVCEIIDMS